MKAIILAAGYGTRMRPLTDTTAKPLLEIGGRRFLDFCLDQILQVPDILDVYVVCNAHYFDQFVRWHNEAPRTVRITLINDGSTSNENRLGAIRDLDLALEFAGKDDVLVLGGDNLFAFSFRRLVELFERKHATIITAHEQPDVEKLRKTGVVEVDANDRVIGFEEKPREPKSRLAVPPVYVYPSNVLPLISEYLNGPRDPDAPGNLISWLYKRVPVYVFRFSGTRFSIDTPETYYALRDNWEDVAEVLREHQ